MNDYYDKTAENPKEEKEETLFEGGFSAEEIITPIPPKKTMAYSVTSLVLSILSLLCCCIGWIGFVLGALAIVFSIVSRRHLGYFDSMAVVSLVLGIIGTVFGLFLGIFEIFMFNSEEFWNELQLELESGDFNHTF